MTIRTLAIAALALISLAAGTARAAAPLETFGKLPLVEMVELSPDGKRIAFVGAIKGVRALTVLEIGGAVLASTPVGSTKIRGLEWAGNDIVLVSNTSTQNWGLATSGEAIEMQEIVSVDLKHKTSFPVLKKAKALGAVFGVFGVRQIDGHWYGYFGGIGTAKTQEGDILITDGLRNIYRVDLETADASLATDGRENDDDWQIGVDGKVIAFAEYKRGSAVWNLFLKGQQAPLLSRPDRFNNSNLIGLGRAPNTLLVGPVEGEDGGIVEVSTEGGQVQPLPTPEHLRRLWFDRRTHLLIGYSAGRDGRDVTMFDPKVQARVRGARQAFPNQKATVSSWSDDFGRMIVLTQGGDDPGTFWLVDITTGKATQIGTRYPLEGKDVGEVRFVQYKAADGTELEGVLTLPPGKSGAKNLPVIVLPHGGPASHDDAVFDWWPQAFASRGYAVFQPNFRGSTGYGRALHDAGYGQWGRKMQTDISDGLAKLAADGIVDARRACIVGGSYGGYAALAGVTVQHGLYRCAISYGGISDLGMMLKEREVNDPATRYWKTFIGAKDANDPVLKTLSPIELAAKTDAPVLLIHGKDDTVVPIRQSQVFERELKKQGKPVQLIVLNGEDHWLSREETRTAMLKASVEFVEKNNPPN